MCKVLILITTESKKNKASNIAKLLIEKKLAACVSIKQIDSIYKWEGDIIGNREFEITIKSKPELKKDLIIFLKKIATYDVPQILFKEFYSEKKYYDWLSETI